MTIHSPNKLPKHLDNPIKVWILDIFEKTRLFFT